MLLASGPHKPKLRYGTTFLIAVARFLSANGVQLGAMSQCACSSPRAGSPIGPPRLGPSTLGGAIFITPLNVVPVALVERLRAVFVSAESFEVALGRYLTWASSRDARNVEIGRQRELKDGAAGRIGARP